MKKTEVFEGAMLHEHPVPYPVEGIKCVLEGSKQNQGEKIAFDENLLSRHVMLLGGIGTGKTNTINQFVQQLRAGFTTNDVAIVFDAKGDFYQRFYQPGDVVISNDNAATGPNGEDFWNLFNEIERDEHMEENIIEIANVLFQNKTEKTNQPFFPNAAKDIFSAVLTHFIKTGNTNIVNNKSLKNFLDQSPTSDFRLLLNKYDEFRSMVSYIYDDNSGQTQGVISELQQTIKEIFIGNFKKRGTLSLRQLVREKQGRFIFIEYDLGVGSMLSPIYGLMFDLAIKEALCRQKSEGNVYFITDEFSLLPNLRHVDDAVNFGRSLGIKFMIGIQNVEQVLEIYGQHKAYSLLSGFLTSIVFRTTDATTKRFIQDLYGTNRKKEIYMASIQGRGIVEQMRDAHVVEDWDITRLALGEAIIGLPGAEPFRFCFAKA